MSGARPVPESVMEGVENVAFRYHAELKVRAEYLLELSNQGRARRAPTPEQMAAQEARIRELLEELMAPVTPEERALKAARRAERSRQK